MRYCGKVDKDDKGQEVFVIPVQIPKPGKPEQSWAPGLVQESKFNEEEISALDPPLHGKRVARTRGGVFWSLFSCCAARMWTILYNTGPVCQ